MTKEVKKPLLLSGKDLMALPSEKYEWIVDGLLRTNRRRPTLLGGKPESGKSTLGRQLAVSVLQGKPFLGRNTVRGDVIYWSTEDTPEDVQDSFRRLGYDAHKDANLFVFNGQPSENNVKALASALEQCLDVKLVIIETLDDLLKIQDIKENSAARIAFDEFETHVLNKFCCRTAFIGLHHLKKRELNSSGDELLGASVIRGRTDGKWYLKPEDDDDPDSRRRFHTKVRTGRNIPKTWLDYDKVTQVSTLGLTVSEERKLGTSKNQERIKTDILEFFHTHPDSNYDRDCHNYIQGDNDAKRRPPCQHSLDRFSTLN